MLTQTKTSFHRLLGTIGLAIVALVLLLSWSAAQGGGVQALSNEPETLDSEVWHDFGVAWASMNVTHTPIVTKAGYVWSIDENDITITFPPNSLYGENSQAVFTFTPQSGDTLPLPLVGSYFFHLDGAYDWGLPVSINQPYTVTLHYQTPDLNGARENSLRFYYQYIETSPPMTTWIPIETSTVDPVQNIIQCSTRRLGRFAVGGYTFQTFIPLVSRNYNN